MNVFSRLLKFALPYRGRFVAAFVAMIFYAAATASLTPLIQPLMDGVLTPATTEKLALTFYGVPVDLRTWSIAVLVIYLVKGL